MRAAASTFSHKQYVQAMADATAARQALAAAVEAQQLRHSDIAVQTMLTVAMEQASCIRRAYKPLLSDATSSK
jgi:ribulose 1,5-bisphosphate carboxylase large subunit-like protein